MRLKRAGLALVLLASALTVLVAPADPPAGADPGRSTTYFADTPDPHVLRVGNRYYAYSTNRIGPWGGLLHLPVLRSTDLQNWDGLVDAFPNLPSWVTPGRTWAPTVYRDGEGYTLFYTATERATGRQCIGRARADGPLGPFRDRRRGPLVCQRDLGGSIDAYVFQDPNGPRYLYWKNDGNCCGLGVSLWGQRLNIDEELVGRPNRLLDYDRAWERPLIENPAMTYAPDRGADYRLFYSANWFESQDYATGFARCRTALGPCVKQTTQAPWHGTTEFAYGPGGAAFFTDSGGRNWMALHGWSRPPGTVGYVNGARRSLFIEKVNFSSTGPPQINSDYPYSYHRSPPHPFTDVPAWADAAVGWAWRQDVVEGYNDRPDRRFYPDRSITRGDAVLQTRRSHPPHRVAPLTQEGRPLTRGQAARLLYGAAGSPRVGRPGFDHDLTDVGAPEALRRAVRWVVHDPDGGGPQEPILTGYPNDTFRPDGRVSRATFVNMLRRWKTEA